MGLKVSGVTGTAINATVFAESSTFYPTASLPPTVFTTISFYFNQTYQLVTGQTYAWWVYNYNATINDANYPAIQNGGSGSSYGGVENYFENSAWVQASGYDLWFYVYGNEETSETTPTPPIDYWYDDDDVTGLMSYLAIILLVAIPMYLFAIPLKMGANGAVIGLGVGAGLGYLIFPLLMPIWLVFLISIGIIAFFIRGFRS